MSSNGMGHQEIRVLPVYGREFILETDHHPLAIMQSAKEANGRIMRWALAMQPYRFRIETIKGAENVGADFLSRSPSEY